MGASSQGPHAVELRGGMQVWPHTQAQPSTLSPSERLSFWQRSSASKTWGHTQKGKVQFLRPTAGHPKGPAPFPVQCPHCICPG